jgi:hypothetical protein
MHTRTPTSNAHTHTYFQPLTASTAYISQQSKDNSNELFVSFCPVPFAGGGGHGHGALSKRSRYRYHIPVAPHTQNRSTSKLSQRILHVCVCVCVCVSVCLCVCVGVCVCRWELGVLIEFGRDRGIDGVGLLCSFLPAEAGVEPARIQSFAVNLVVHLPP